MKKNYRPICQANSHYFCMLGNVDCNAKRLDTPERKFAQVYSIRMGNIADQPDAELSGKIRQINYLRSDPNEVRQQYIDNLRPAKIETGFLISDAALDRSLSNVEMEAISSQISSYLDESEEIERRKKAFETDGPLGPPLSNPSQLHQMASFYALQEEAGTWEPEEFTWNEPRAITDPKFKVLL